MNIERDFSRVDFEREFDAGFLIFVQNRNPTFGKEFEAVVDPALRNRRKTVQVRPNRRAGEAGNDFRAEFRGGPSGVDHLLRAVFPNRFGRTVAVQTRRNDGQVAGVDLIENALTDAVVRNGVAVEPVFFELSAFGGAITVVLQRELNVEVALERVVIVRAGAASEFETGIADFGHNLEELFRRNVAKLTGNNRNKRRIPTLQTGFHIIAIKFFHQADLNNFHNLTLNYRRVILNENNAKKTKLPRCSANNKVDYNRNQRQSQEKKTKRIRPNDFPQTAVVITVVKERVCASYAKRLFAPNRLIQVFSATLYARSDAPSAVYAAQTFRPNDRFRIVRAKIRRLNG